MPGSLDYWIQSPVFSCLNFLTWKLGVIKVPGLECGCEGRNELGPGYALRDGVLCAMTAGELRVYTNVGEIFTQP